MIMAVFDSKSQAPPITRPRAGGDCLNANLEFENQIYSIAAHPTQITGFHIQLSKNLSGNQTISLAYNFREPPWELVSALGSRT
jgi:hypothetical protein